MAHTYRKPPISSHRLFPSIVAIWFAVLFGLGCLVLPAVLLERAAEASRIDALVPAAAPPLGLTARIAMAAAAAVFGAFLGFAIARRVAAAQAPGPPVDFDRLLRPANEAPAERIRRPISASEELGDARLDAPVDEPAMPSPLARKRPLALPEEPAPAHFQQFDPPAGPTPPWADEHPLMPSATAIAEKAMALHGPDRGQFEIEPQSVPEPTEPEAPFAAPPAAAEAEPATPADPASPLHAEAPPASQEPARADEHAAAFAAPEEPAAPFVAEGADESAPLVCEPAPAEPPREFAAPSQAQRPAAPVRSRAELAAPLRALLAGELAPTDKVGGPLEHLGMAELAERLARSMQNYDSKLPPLAPAAGLQPEAPAAPPADFAPPPPVIPDALRPFAPELEEFGEDEDDAAEGLDPASYGSLLAMTGAPRPFDAPPEAERPMAGPGPRLDPAETERALRSALATLQRMSGAA